MTTNLSQEDLQRDYVRSLIILHDIEKNGQAYAKAAESKDLMECFRLLKNGFLAYSMLNDALKTLSKYTIGDEDLSSKLKGLRRKLEFMNHLRNKCSGHLDDAILDKAIQWEPSLFTEQHVNNEHHIFLVYRTLLESAINSYMDENGKQKYFGSEIDLFYPPNWDSFIHFMSESELASSSFLNSILEKIKSRLKLLTSHREVCKQAIYATETDFRLPKKGR